MTNELRVDRFGNGKCVWRFRPGEHQGSLDKSLLLRHPEHDNEHRLSGRHRSYDDVIDRCAELHTRLIPGQAVATDGGRPAAETISNRRSFAGEILSAITHWIAIMASGETLSGRMRPARRRRCGFRF